MGKMEKSIVIRFPEAVAEFSTKAAIEMEPHYITDEFAEKLVNIKSVPTPCKRVFTK